MPQIVAHIHEMLEEEKYGYDYVSKLPVRLKELQPVHHQIMQRHLAKVAQGSRLKLWAGANRLIIDMAEDFITKQKEVERLEAVHRMELEKQKERGQNNKEAKVYETERVVEAITRRSKETATLEVKDLERKRQMAERLELQKKTFDADRKRWIWFRFAVAFFIVSLVTVLSTTAQDTVVLGACLIVIFFFSALLFWRSYIVGVVLPKRVTADDLQHQIDVRAEDLRLKALNKLEEEEEEFIAKEQGEKEARRKERGERKAKRLKDAKLAEIERKKQKELALKEMFAYCYNQQIRFESVIISGLGILLNPVLESEAMERGGTLYGEALSSSVDGDSRTFFPAEMIKVYIQVDIINRSDATWLPPDASHISLRMNMVNPDPESRLSDDDAHEFKYVAPTSETELDFGHGNIATVSSSQLLKIKVVGVISRHEDQDQDCTSISMASLPTAIAPSVVSFEDDVASAVSGEDSGSILETVKPILLGSFEQSLESVINGDDNPAATWCLSPRAAGPRGLSPTVTPQKQDVAGFPSGAQVEIIGALTGPGYKARRANIGSSINSSMRGHRRQSHAAVRPPAEDVLPSGPGASSSGSGATVRVHLRKLGLPVLVSEYDDRYLDEFEPEGF